MNQPIRKTEIAVLNLSTADIFPHNGISSYQGQILNYEAVFDNSVGVWSHMGSYFKFKDIDLKELLGDMWAKYDEFKIELVHFQSLWVNGGVPIFNASNYPENRNLYLNMAGLSWVGAGFDQSTGNYQSHVHISNLSNQFLLADNSENFSQSLFSGSEYTMFEHNAFADSTIRFNKTKSVTDLEFWFGNSKNKRLVQPSPNWGAYRIPGLVMRFNLYPVHS